MACKQILTKLQTLSDQPASRPSAEGQLAHGNAPTGLRTRDRHALAVKSNRASTSKLPGRVADRLNDAEELDRSLFHYYLPRMQAALKSADITQTYKLIQEAHEDHLEHIGHPSEVHFATANEAVEYLLTNHEGVPAERAAIKMHMRTESLKSAVEWVRKSRRQNGRNPETGALERVDGRTQRIYALADQGASTRAIAAEVQLSHTYVGRILRGAA
jgi:hypothetical protein